MNTNSNTNKEEKVMKNEKVKKFLNGTKKVFGVLVPVALVTGGVFIAKSALKAVGADDAAEAIDEMGEEITETLEDNFEEVE